MASCAGFAGAAQSARSQSARCWRGEPRTQRKPDEGDPERRRDPVPERGPQVHRLADAEGASAQHTTAIANRVMPIWFGSLGVGIPAPLPYVANHVVEAPPVDWLHSDGFGAVPCIPVPPTVGVESHVATVVPPRIESLRTRTARILPLRLGRQPVAVGVSVPADQVAEFQGVGRHQALALGQGIAELDRLVPRHVVGGQPVVVLVAGPFARPAGHHQPILLAGNGGRLNLERGYCHALNGALVGVTARFGDRTPQPIRSGGDANHLWPRLGLRSCGGSPCFVGMRVAAANFVNVRVVRVGRPVVRRHRSRRPPRTNREGRGPDAPGDPHGRAGKAHPRR